MAAYHSARSTTDQSVRHLISDARWEFHLACNGPLAGLCGDPAEKGEPVEPSRVCTRCFDKAADKRMRALSKSVTLK